MALKTYKPQDFSLIVGTAIIDGFQEETMIEITWEGEFFNESRDTSGQVTRFKLTPPHATIVVYLTQASLSNDTFSAFMVADLTNSAGAFPVHIVDGSGTTTFTATNCWIQKPVDNISFGNDEKGRQWTIRATDITHFVGGIN